MESEVVTNLTSDLSGCSEYNGDVKAAVDELLVLLVRFVADRINAQANRKNYLFDPEANENDLHQDLYDYLRSTDLGATTENGGSAHWRWLHRYPDSLQRILVYTLN
jgi:hypothetical protein